MAVDDSIQDVRKPYSAQGPDSGVKILRFQLYDDLIANGSALAYRVDYGYDAATNETHYFKSTAQYYIWSVLGFSAKSGDTVRAYYCWDSRRWEVITSTDIAFRNDSAEQIPLHGIMEVTGYDETAKILTVTKPTYSISTTSLTPGKNYLAKIFLVNVGGTVDPTKTGYGRFPRTTADGAVTITYDPAYGVPAFGNCIGPFYGDWKGRLHIKGWEVLSVDISAGTCRVLQNELRSIKGTSIQAYGSTGAIGAFGVVAPITPGSETRNCLAQYDPLAGLSVSASRIQVVNGATAAGAIINSFLEVTMPIDEPVYAAMHASLPSVFYSTSTSGFSFGIVPGTDKLGPGLPGFISLEIQATSTAKRIAVVRDFVTSSWWAKVVSWNVATGALTAQPCTDQTGAYVYDGSGGMPTISAMTIQVDCILTIRCPNIAVGDIIRYSFGPQRYTSGSLRTLHTDTLYLESDCFDDPIGTVKAWMTGSPPRGWRRVTACDDSIITSYSATGIDRIPTHDGAGTNRPSYSFIWIERYQ